MWRVAVVGSVLALAAACDDTALVFELTSARPVPGELDGVCLSVAALDADGDSGVFARRYPLSSLPQTLTVLPGGHDRVRAWARGMRGGVETSRAGGDFDFTGGQVGRARLELPHCPGGTLAPRMAGQTTVPAGARVAMAFGWRASQLVVVAPGAATRWTGDAAGLREREGGLPAAPASGAAVLLAFDADDDCDDDLLVGAPDATAALWRQAADGSFVSDDAGLATAGVLAAAASGDVDADGDLDLVVASGGRVTLLRNDGAGRFVVDAAAVPASAATDATALALGDVSGDGHPDLAIGQGSAAAAPRVLLVNDPSGSGAFEAAPALLPALAERTRALAMVDADGDGDLDLFTAGLGAPVRLYVNRGDGRLEDRSFVRLPSVTAVDVSGLGAADFDGDCLVDLGVARADGSFALWRGTDGGVLVDQPLAGATGDAVSLDDLDGDGRRDLLVAGGGVLAWIAPR